MTFLWNFKSSEIGYGVGGGSEDEGTVVTCEDCNNIQYTYIYIVNWYCNT